MKEKTENTKKKSALETVIYVIMTALIVIVALWLIVMIFARVKGEDAELFGYKLYYVQTGSMSPAIEAGDAILARHFTPGDELQIGDIVSYAGRGQLEGQSITHRIVSIEGEPGSRVIVTRGDANNVSDSAFPEARITSVYVRRLAVLGKVLTFLRSKAGILVVWVCIGAFAAYWIFNMVKSGREAALEEAAAKEESPADSPDGKPDDTENKE